MTRLVILPMREKSLKVIKDLPLGVYEKAISSSLLWEDKLLLAKGSGFDCVELSIDGTDERISRLYDKGTAKTISNAIKATGVPIYTMALTANRLYPLGSEDNKTREMGLELVERAIGLAEELGIKVVHLAAYDDLDEKANNHTKSLFRSSIEKCIRMVEGRPINIALETMDAEFMGSCTNIVALCKEMKSNQLRCYADIGNLTAMGLDPSVELPIGGELIAGIHLKDAMRNICRDVPFGKGIVDFDLSLRTLHNMGYNGYMTAEMWSYDKDGFHPYLKEASKFLRDKLEKY